MNKEDRIKELIENYNYWDKQDIKSSHDAISCLARDNKRIIMKKFEIEMHESILNYL